MATETHLRKMFVRALKRVNAKVVPYTGSTMGEAGTADVFVGHTRWNGWIEFKGPNTKIRPLQVLFQKDMLQRGVRAHIVRLLDSNTFMFDGPFGGGYAYTWEDGADILDSILEEEARSLK